MICFLLKVFSKPDHSSDFVYNAAPQTVTSEGLVNFSTEAGKRRWGREA